VVAVALATLVLAGIVAPRVQAEDAAEVRARAQEITQELSDAQTRLGQLERAISTAAFEAEDAERQLGDLQAEVEQAAVQRYTNRDQESLLRRTDVNGNLRAEAMLRLIGQGDVDAIDRYSELRVEADDAGERLARLESEQVDAVETLQATSDELQAELVRLEELERRQREEAARRAEAARKAEEERLAREAAAATAAAAPSEPATATPPSDGGGGGGGAPPPPRSSGFLCPVPSATFIDSWGFARAGGRSHQGVDMMASSGSPIYAPVSGNLRPNQNGLGGLAFYLDGDNGDRYYGAHMSAYGATGRVAAGTVIGYVGNTGDARYTASHLHFEIHPGGGSAVNPYPTVRAAC
jgi:murein DD-endopeptidase MepM/ murein hydrolase activator NlpD